MHAALKVENVREKVGEQVAVGEWRSPESVRTGPPQ